MHGRASYFGDETSNEEKERWRLWMIEVFEPLNARMEKVILENGDLLEGNRVPDVFVETLAHIAAYRALYAKWNEGDYSVHTSLIDYPTGLLAEVERTYDKLLARRKRLAGER